MKYEKITNSQNIWNKIDTTDYSMRKNSLVKVVLGRFTRWNTCLISGCMQSNKFKYIWESMKTSRSIVFTEKLLPLVRCSTRMLSGIMLVGLRA